MTPQEKAKELVDSFDRIMTIPTVDCKLCALICVEEIINACCEHCINPEYWLEVKTEIEAI